MPHEQPSPRWWQRLLQQIPSTAVGARVFSRTLHHIDPLLLRLSDGHVSIPQVLAGLPTIELTTIGAKSGKERTVPVLTHSNPSQSMSASGPKSSTGNTE